MIFLHSGKGNNVKFSDIIGHERIVAHLKSAAANDRISHAYIFNGEDDCGKSFTADIFAAAIQCESKADAPCGKCKSCIQAFSGNHPDIIKVTHEKSLISVDDIRVQVNSDIAIKPYSSRYKIYIVDEAEKMNEQAQNALLKTIEEPPEYAVIILLTNNAGRFLPTILSRCIKLDFRSVSNELVKKYLMEECKLPDYQAGLSAAFSSGNIGKAKKHAESEEFSERLAQVTKILKGIDRMRIDELNQAVKYFASVKAQIDECIDLAELWFRDVLVYKASKDTKDILYKNEAEAIKEQAASRSFEAFDSIQKEFSTLRARIRANVNFEASIEMFLLNVGTE